MNKFNFGGIKIDNLRKKEVLEKIEELINKGDRSYIVTPNAAHIVLLQKDIEFRKIYENANLVLADGMSIVWSSKALRNPLKERITGVDLLYIISSLSSQKDYSIFLLGAENDIVEKVSRNLQYKFPNLNIVGFHNGYFIDDGEIIKKINEVSPYILFIGMGFFKQEKWIYKNLEKLNIKIAVCIGGVFDIIGGKRKRAPKWIQNMGIEWLWRLIQEPKRLWKRYLIGNTIFIFLLLRELVNMTFFRKHI